MTEDSSKEKAVEKALARAKEFREEGMPAMAIQVEIKAFLAEHDVDEESAAVVLGSLAGGKKKADDDRPLKPEVGGRAEMIVGGVALALGVAVVVFARLTGGKPQYYAMAGGPLIVGLVVLIKGYFDLED